jgi:hypothetical protein
MLQVNFLNVFYLLILCVAKDSACLVVASSKYYPGFTLSCVEEPVPLWSHVVEWLTA